MMATGTAKTRTIRLANGVVIELHFCHVDVISKTWFESDECVVELALVNGHQWYKFLQDYFDVYGDDERPATAIRLYPDEAAELLCQRYLQSYSLEVITKLTVLMKDGVLPTTEGLKKIALTTETLRQNATELALPSPNSQQRLALESLRVLEYSFQIAQEQCELLSPFSSVERSPVLGFVDPATAKFLASTDEWVESLPASYRNEVKSVMSGLQRCNAHDAPGELSALRSVLDQIEKPTGVQNQSGSRPLSPGPNSSLSLLASQLDRLGDDDKIAAMFDFYFATFLINRETLQRASSRICNCDATSVEAIKRVLFGDKIGDANVVTSCPPTEALTLREWQEEYRHILNTILVRRSNMSWEDCAEVIVKFTGKKYSGKNLRAALTNWLVKRRFAIEILERSAGKKKPDETKAAILQLLD